MTQPTWADRVALLVAEQVRRYREARGLSAQQVADACDKLGFPLKRSVLANLENGRRTTVTVAEVVVLAKVLGVPPLQLIYPIGRRVTVEALPDEQRLTWDAAKWFTGWQPFPGSARLPELEEDHAGTREDRYTWDTGAVPINAHRGHDQRVTDWTMTDQQRQMGEELLTTLSDERDKVQLSKNLQRVRERLRSEAQELVEFRHGMRRDGMVPPPLPPWLVVELGEPSFVVYERFNASGVGVLERRVVDACSEDDYRLMADDEWAWLDVPFRERPSNWRKDDDGSGL